MAHAAIGSELTAVRIIPFMAGVTIFWRAFEDTVLMALFTRNGQMFSDQRESKLRMVNVDLIPAISGMTLRAVRAKLALMFIILRVARMAVHRRALENIIDMAFLASHAYMFAG